MGEIREQGADHAPEAPKKKRTPLFVALGCASFFLFACCGSCVLLAVGGQRHQRDLVAFTPPPLVDPATESDPGWRRVAAARRDAESAACEDFVSALRVGLADASREETVAFHEFVRARAAESNTQGLRDACSAAFHGVCGESRFLAFRVELVTLGHAAFEASLADPDSLAPVLAPEPSCEAMTWAALAALRERVAFDAGLAPSDAGVEADAGLAPIATEPEPIASTTRTRARGRFDLPSRVPRLCARFSCSLRDVFD